MGGVSPDPTHNLSRCFHFAMGTVSHTSSGHPRNETVKNSNAGLEEKIVGNDNKRKGQTYRTKNPAFLFLSFLKKFVL